MVYSVSIRYLISSLLHDLLRLEQNILYSTYHISDANNLWDICKVFLRHILPFSYYFHYSSIISPVLANCDWHSYIRLTVLIVPFSNCVSPPLLSMTIYCVLFVFISNPHLLYSSTRLFSTYTNILYVFDKNLIIANEKILFVRRGLVQFRVELPNSIQVFGI